MLSVVIEKQKETKNILIFSGVFVFVYGLYLFLDWLAHGSFAVLFDSLGTPLFLVHQVFNVVLALIAALMISLSQIKLRLTSVEPKGSTSIPFFSFIFGLLTFGCAPCVVAMLGAIGITFTPIVLPFGNLPWKIILLGIMAVGFYFILRSIDQSTCTSKSLKN